MQTNSVANPLNTLTPPPAAKGGQKSDGPAFDQVLSREIADRKDAEPAQKSSDTQASSPVKGEQGKQGKQEQTTATNSANKTDTADKAEKAEEVAENAAGTEVAQETVSSVSAEMLALVNSLNLTPLQTDKPVAAGSTDLLASKGKRAEALLTVADKLTSMATTEQQVAPDDAPGKSRVPDLKMDTATSAVIDIAKDVGRNVKSDAAFTAELQSALDTAPNGLQSLQQNAHVTAQTATAQVTEHIAPRVGTPAWDQAIGQRVVWMVNGDQQTAELTLNPPDLGPLKVVLNVSNAQADATFTAAQPEVRQALEAAMPKLRDMLNEAGIQLGQASVNSGQPNQQSDGDRQAARGANQDSTQSDGRSEAANVARVQPASVGRGLVDTFV